MRKLLLLIFLLPLFAHAQVAVTVQKNGLLTQTKTGTSNIIDTSLVSMTGAASATNGVMLIWDSTLKKAKSGGAPSVNTFTSFTNGYGLLPTGAQTGTVTSRLDTTIFVPYSTNFKIKQPTVIGGAFNLPQNRNTDYVSEGSHPYMLETVGTGGNKAQFAITQYSDDQGGNSFHTRKARGTQSSPTSALSGDRLGSYGMKGYISSLQQFSYSSAAIIATATEDFTATHNGTKLEFGTTAKGTNTRLSALTLEDTGSGTFAGNVKVPSYLFVGTDSTGILTKKNSLGLQTDTLYIANSGPLHSSVMLRSQGQNAIIVDSNRVKIKVLSAGGIVATNPTTGGQLVLAVPEVQYVTPTGAGALTNKNLTSGTNTFPTFNQNTTGSAATWTTGRTVSITGDLAYTSPSLNGSGNVTAAGTLATVNSNVGSFGSATQSPVVTVNAKGLTTAVSNITITPAASSITGGAALTKVDDTNVTLTLTGTPSVSLLSAAGLTLGWSGNLSVARGGTGTGTAGIGAVNNISGRSYTGFTGSGNLVGSNAPTLTTPDIGSATGTSLNATTYLGVGASVNPASFNKVISVTGTNSAAYTAYNGTQSFQMGITSGNAWGLYSSQLPGYAMSVNGSTGQPTFSYLAAATNGRALVASTAGDVSATGVVYENYRSVNNAGPGGVGNAVTATDKNIELTGVGLITVNLPAGEAAGRIVDVINSSTGTCTVLVLGVPNPYYVGNPGIVNTSYSLAPGAAATFVCAGSNAWRIK